MGSIDQVYYAGALFHNTHRSYPNLVFSRVHCHKIRGLSQAAAKELSYVRVPRIELDNAFIAPIHAGGFDLCDLTRRFVFKFGTEVMRSAPIMSTVLILVPALIANNSLWGGSASEEKVGGVSKRKITRAMASDFFSDFTTAGADEDFDDDGDASLNVRKLRSSGSTSRPKILLNAIRGTLQRAASSRTGFHVEDDDDDDDDDGEDDGEEDGEEECDEEDHRILQ